MDQATHSFVVEKLEVRVFPDRQAMGRAAGQAVAAKMKELLNRQNDLSVVFAAAPSQNEFLEGLSQSQGIPWQKVTAFHLDEYVGLPSEAPQSFGYFLRVRIFEKVRPGKVHYLNAMAKDPLEECRRYASLVKGRPFDIACIGIGENGHLAFNDPPVADFEDPRVVKVVDLDLVSREQQVHDGCFESLDNVPQKAITLTIPTIFRAKSIYCMVPGLTKAEAVKKTLEGPISTACPATVLRKHANAVLFLDGDSARGLEPGQRQRGAGCAPR